MKMWQMKGLSLQGGERLGFCTSWSGLEEISNFCNSEICERDVWLRGELVGARFVQEDTMSFLEEGMRASSRVTK